MDKKPVKDDVNLNFVNYFGKIILREIFEKMTQEQKIELIPECD